jgi:hypothetical protein
MTRKPACWLVLAEKTRTRRPLVSVVIHCLELLRSGNLPTEEYRATFEHVQREWPRIAPPEPPPEAEPGVSIDTPETREVTSRKEEKGPRSGVTIDTPAPKRIGKEGKSYAVPPPKPKTPEPEQPKGRSVVNNVEQDAPPEVAQARSLGQASQEAVPVARIARYGGIGAARHSFARHAPAFASPLVEAGRSSVARATRPAPASPGPSGPRRSSRPHWHMSFNRVLLTA